MGNLELELINNLKKLREACEGMIKADSVTFKDNEVLKNMAIKAAYHAFYEVTCQALDDYYQAKETEIEEYENYLTGGLKE